MRSLIAHNPLEKDDTRTKLKGGSLVAIGRLPLTDSFGVYAKAGAFAAALDVDAFNESETYDEVSPVVGAGVDFRITEHLTTFLEYNRYYSYRQPVKGEIAMAVKFEQAIPDSPQQRAGAARQPGSVDQSDRRVPINLRQSGPTPVEMLISTRVRKSPYWHLAFEAGCWRATVYNRMYHPRGYVRPEDGGAMVEYESLIHDVTMWNVAVERQIQVKGPDAERFVNYVITRDATKIKPMHGKYVILCNEEGGILNDPVLLRIAEDEFWFPCPTATWSTGCGV